MVVMTQMGAVNRRKTLVLILFFALFSFSVPHSKGGYDPFVEAFSIPDLSNGLYIYKTLWYSPTITVHDPDGISTITVVEFAFQTDRGWHNISHNYETGEYYIVSGDSRIGIRNGHTEISGTRLIVTFNIKAKPEMDVKRDIDVYARVFDKLTGYSGWTKVQTKYFSIFDLGDDWVDTDGDKTPNWADDDIDDDWVPNEFDDDIDGDGILNEQDPDPYIPEAKPKVEYLLSFVAPSGRLVNFIPIGGVKAYQPLLAPLVVIVVIIIGVAILLRGTEKKGRRRSVRTPIGTDHYDLLEELLR